MYMLPFGFIMCSVSCGPMSCCHWLTVRLSATLLVWYCFTDWLVIAISMVSFMWALVLGMQEHADLYVCDVVGGACDTEQGHQGKHHN